MGYDGRGQRVIRAAAEAAAALAELGSVPCIVEAFVPFERELSILAVRASNGASAFYPVVENHHRDGILRLSLAPAPGCTPSLQSRAQTLAHDVLSALDYVGVIAIELFQRGEQLLANEIAPRVHNSGHWTIEGAATSQFENHLRAITDQPLGSTAARGVSAMVNLIGTVPDLDAVRAIPGAHVHLYGKSPRPGRKLGHVTVNAESEAALRVRLEPLLALVGERPPAPSSSSPA
jgi:5-(carboxyamino)imidazole ribonucleotide synthase